MDAGIIVSNKRRYRTMQYNLALDVLGTTADIYKIDPLTTMLYLKAIWTVLPSDSIQNCWEKGGLFLFQRRVRWKL